MAADQRPLSEALSSNSSTLSGRGRWNWQRVARAGWVVIACALLVIFFANIPAYYQSFNSFCTQASPDSCPTGQLTLGNVQALVHLHLSVTAVVYFLATLTLAVSVFYWLVGLLLFQRKSQEWMGLLSSLVFVMLGAVNIFGFPVAQAPQLVQFLTTTITFVLTPAVITFLVTFPTGSFTPRWTLVVFVLALLGSLPFVPLVGNLLTFPLLVWVQIYRYLHVYDAVQRQQVKWFVFAVGGGLSLYVIYHALGAVVPGLSAPDSWFQLLNVLSWLLIWLLLLLSTSVAILRYRLWDIDVIINRTLIYGSLTLLLLVLYVGLILALQTLVQATTGSISQQPLVIVSSTLVIVALFQPLRHRLQTLIDRRFYRRKYDATRVITAFSTLLRQEVDLDQLHEQLLEVVQETMQPTHVSLWMRKPSRTVSPSLKVNKLSPHEARSLR